MPGGGYRGTQGRKPKASTISERIRNQEEDGQLGEEGDDNQVPKPPRYLGRVEKKEWDRLAPKLWEQGFLTELDLGTLAMYCDAHGQYCRAKEMLTGPVGLCPNCKPSRKKRPEDWEDCLEPHHKETAYGEIIPMPRRLGRRDKSPYVALKKEAEALMTRLSGELGLTVASRSRLPGGKATKPTQRRPFNPPTLDQDTPDNDPRKILEMQVLAGKS